MEKKLSDYELTKLENHSLKIGNKLLEIKLIQEKTTVMEREVEALKLRTELRRRQGDSLTIQKDSLLAKAESLRESYRSYKTLLEDQLEITTEKWGYDPITGIITEEEQGD